MTLGGPHILLCDDGSNGTAVVDGRHGVYVARSRVRVNEVQPRITQSGHGRVFGLNELQPVPLHLRALHLARQEFDLAFAFGWTPCVGPVLAAILFTAAGAETAQTGAALLFVYGAGMTLPFVVAALFIGPFMRWMTRFRRHLPVVEKLMGLMLIAFGILIGTNRINYIAEWMLNFMPALG